MKNAMQFAQSVFAAVDSMDGERLATFLTPDAAFTFGNNETVAGGAAIAGYVNGFFSTIAGLSHKIVDVWQQENTLITRLAIDYTRKDGKVVHLPCANIWVMKGELIADYRIYMDVSLVYAQ